MSLLRSQFLKADADGAGFLKVVNFKRILASILKNQGPDSEAFSLLTDYGRNPDNEEQIMFDKLNTLIELYQFYPLIIKRSKNQSSGMQYVFNTAQGPLERTAAFS